LIVRGKRIKRIDGGKEMISYLAIRVTMNCMVVQEAINFMGAKAIMISLVVKEMTVIFLILMMAGISSRI